MKASFTHTLYVAMLEDRASAYDLIFTIDDFLYFNSYFPLPHTQMMSYTSVLSPSDISGLCCALAFNVPDSSG